MLREIFFPTVFHSCNGCKGMSYLKPAVRCLLVSQKEITTTGVLFYWLSHNIHPATKSSSCLSLNPILCESSSWLLCYLVVLFPFCTDILLLFMHFSHDLIEQLPEIILLFQLHYVTPLLQKQSFEFIMFFGIACLCLYFPCLSVLTPVPEIKPLLYS